MTATPLLDADIGHDATDCRAAFEASRVTLADGAAATAAGEPAAPVEGGQAPAAGTVAATPGTTPEATGPATPASGAPDFGDDSSRWAHDGECDDRRFVGEGMAGAVSWENAGRDATDCRAAHDAGRARVWGFAAAREALQCARVDFGNEGGQFASDGECDDSRFEGLGMVSSVAGGLVGQDATDCARLCAFGLIGLRDR